MGRRHFRCLRYMCAVRDAISKMLERCYLPVRWDLPEPLDPRVPHRHVAVQPLGDSVRDDGLPLLLEQNDESLLLGHEGVDFRRLAIEEGGDGGLLAKWGECGKLVEILLLVQILDARGLLD